MNSCLGSSKIAPTWIERSEKTISYEPLQGSAVVVCVGKGVNAAWHDEAQIDLLRLLMNQRERFRNGRAHVENVGKERCFQRVH